VSAPDAPATVLDAVVRELRSAAYDGAMRVALATTAPDSEERRDAVRGANLAFTMPVTDEAYQMITYLNVHFETDLDPAKPRVEEA
jgi:hypothetical protein